MAYIVVKSELGMSFDYGCRDESQGILGQIPVPASSLLTVDNLEDARLHAFAHVGRFPQDSLCIIDDAGRVFDIVINDEYHSAVTRNAKHLFIAWACFGMTLVGLLASSLVGHGIAGFIFSSTSIPIYLLSVKTGTFNEVESLIVSVIIATLVVTLLPAFESLILGNAG